MKLKLSISMLAVFFIWGMSLLYAFGQVDVDHDENEEGSGGGQGYQLQQVMCNFDGGLNNGCKNLCPSGSDPSCTLHVCRSWYECME